SDLTPHSETVSVNKDRLTITLEAGLSLTAIDPASGPAAGGTVVTLTGTGFEPSSQVYVDGHQALTEFVSATTMRMTTPAHAPGSVYVLVHNADFRYAALFEAFRYL